MLKSGLEILVTKLGCRSQAKYLVPIGYYKVLNNIYVREICGMKDIAAMEH